MVNRLSWKAITALMMIWVVSCTTASDLATTNPTDETTVPAVPASTEGVDFDTYVEASFAEYLSRFPEEATALGLSQLLEISDDRLNDYSDSYQQETTQIMLRIRAALTGFVSDKLTDDQELTREAFIWYLDQEIDLFEYRLYDWPVHYLVTGYNQGVIGLFTTIHPLQNSDQIEAYVDRLRQIDRQVLQVIANMQLAVDGGFTPPRYVLDYTVSQLESDIAQGQPTSTAIYQAAQSRIDQLDIDSPTKADYLDEIAREIEDSFIPAWIELIDFLNEVKPLATNEISLNRLPYGDAYYETLLRFHTSTDLSADEISRLGQIEVDRITGEIRDLAARNEIDSDQLEAIRDAFARRCGFVESDEIVSTYERIINDSTEFFQPYFSVQPQAALEIVNDPGPVAFYIGPSVDGSRPGSFHAGTGGGSVPVYTMRSLAIHETVPGHHFQISLAQESNLPSPRKFFINTGQVEGWALYAERLAGELGMYVNDPGSDFGRLDFELLRAARMVVDTGIHHQGWSRDEAIDAMESIMGGPEYNQEVDRYVMYPGQATAYMLGMLKILSFRDTYGVDFDEPASVASFHERFLEQGNMPLVILQRLFDPD